jgi:hypothetical protein
MTSKFLVVPLGVRRGRFALQARDSRADTVADWNLTVAAARGTAVPSERARGPKGVSR